jgi:putative membrane protein
MIARFSVFLTLAFFALFHPLLALAQQSQQPTDPQQPPWNWPGPWHMWGGGWAFWWVFPLMMLFMIVVCIAVFMIGQRSSSDGTHEHRPAWHATDRPWGRDPTYSALQVLNERFAKGEIQKEEYQEKKAAILSIGQC